MTLLISLVLICIAIYFKAQLDIITFCGIYNEQKRKYYLTLDGKFKYYKNKDWYYFGRYPKFKERFPYSTTLLVCFSNRWNLYRYICFRSLYLAIAIQISGLFMSIVLTFIIFPFIQWILFTLLSRKFNIQ
ncbi:MAG: hypothetical protein EBU90_25050 [Proteobacteria bacterium]|nr:hypothetical protein [Pseudomonadota bacterium]NBP16663.1 hypothetical protein [bacterium]